MERDSFVEFVEDQLSGLPDVRSRAMFGGYGFYQRDVFFAIIFKGRLYFKTNARTARDYIKLGMKSFEPKPGQGLKNYYEVPVDVMEDDSKLVTWARAAIQSG